MPTNKQSRARKEADGRSPISSEMGDVIRVDESSTPRLKTWATHLTAWATRLSHAKYTAILGVIVACALATRAAMLVDFMRSNPIAGSPDGDAAVYWEMAGRIAGGQWIDNKPFMSVPLYTYALACVRALGGGLISVYVLQLLTHVITAVMLAHLTTQKFGRAAGLCAAGLFVLLQEPAFLSTRLLPSTLQLLVVTATLLAAQRFWVATALGDAAHKGRRYTDAALVGLTTGLLALIYPPALIVVPLLLPWMTLMRAADFGPRGLTLDASHKGEQPAARWGRRNGLACGAIALAGACLVILPTTWHNWRACGEFIPVTAHAGITFRQGNAPGSSGTYTAVEGVSPARRKMHLDAARVYASRMGRSGTYGEINRYYFAQGADYLASDFANAFRLVGRKFYWFLTGRHYSDIYYPSLEQEDGWVNLLFLAPLPTAWLMGPALIGLIGYRRVAPVSKRVVPVSNRSETRVENPCHTPPCHDGPVPQRFHAIDWAMLFLPVLIVMTFWYSLRYRLPALPMLIVASAGAFATMWHRFPTGADYGLKTRATLHRATLSIVLIVASIATGPINSVVGFDRPEDFRPQYECNRGQVYARLGQYDFALERFIKSDRLQPDQPIVLTAMAEAYTRLARLGEAERVCRRLLEIDPDSITTWLAYGSLHVARGHWTDAEDAFKRCLRIDPLSPEAHWGMWATVSNLDRPGETLAHLWQVVQLDPSHGPAASEYGIWLAQQGRLEEAEYYLRRARRLSPLQPEAHFNLGMLLMEAGRLYEAASCFRDALGVDPAYLKAQRALNAIENRSGHPPTSMRSTGKSAPQAGGDPRPQTRGNDSRSHNAPPISEEMGRPTGQGSPTGPTTALERQIELRPDDASLYSRLAGMLYARGDAKRAVAVLRKAVAQADDTATVTVELAWLLSTAPETEVRDGQEAVRLVLKALTTVPSAPPEYLDVLAAAYAELGQFERAVQEAQRAATIAAQQGRTDLAEMIQRRAELYESRTPFRQ